MNRHTTARTEKARFLRWARQHPAIVSVSCRGLIFWHDSFPECQVNADATTYCFTVAPFRDLSAAQIRHCHETGSDDLTIPPLHRPQFWRYLPRHCRSFETQEAAA